jgi:hypothetical protein
VKEIQEKLDNFKHLYNISHKEDQITEAVVNEYIVRAENGNQLIIEIRINRIIVWKIATSFYLDIELEEYRKQALIRLNQEVFNMGISTAFMQTMRFAEEWNKRFNSK